MTSVYTFGMRTYIHNDQVRIVVEVHLVRQFKMFWCQFIFCLFHIFLNSENFENVVDYSGDGWTEGVFINSTSVVSLRLFHIVVYSNLFIWLNFLSVMTLIKQLLGMARKNLIIDRKKYWVVWFSERNNVVFEWPNANIPQRSFLLVFYQWNIFICH